MTRPHDPIRPTGERLDLSEAYPVDLAPGDPRIWIRITIEDLNDPHASQSIVVKPEEAETIAHRLLALAAKAVS